jgi:hypothetical protein
MMLTRQELQTVLSLLKDETQILSRTTAAFSSIFERSGDRFRGLAGLHALLVADTLAPSARVAAFVILREVGRVVIDAVEVARANGKSSIEQTDQVVVTDITCHPFVPVFIAGLVAASTAPVERLLLHLLVTCPFNVELPVCGHVVQVVAQREFDDDDNTLLILVVLPHTHTHTYSVA